MATHGGWSEGRGGGRDRASHGSFRLLEQGALPTMRARYLGPLVVRRVFQMLITILAGAFVRAGCCHPKEIETCIQT